MKKGMGDEDIFPIAFLRRHSCKFFFAAAVWKMKVLPPPPDHWQPPSTPPITTTSPLLQAPAVIWCVTFFCRRPSMMQDTPWLKKGIWWTLACRIIILDSMILLSPGWYSFSPTYHKLHNFLRWSLKSFISLSFNNGSYQFFCRFYSCWCRHRTCCRFINYCTRVSFLKIYIYGVIIDYYFLSDRESS